MQQERADSGPFVRDIFYFLMCTAKYTYGGEREMKQFAMITMF